eukprot:12164031-Heterocapsa_arctica.AAC.1
MTRQDYKTWSCEHRTGAGHEKDGDKITKGQLGFVTRENMSEAPKSRLLRCKDISYQAEDNGEIGHRQNAKDYRHLISDFSDTIERI